MPFLSKLRFRYSLRILLAAVTPLCVALGSQVSKAQEFREAVEIVERNGGLVTYGHKSVGKDALGDKTTEQFTKKRSGKRNRPERLRDQLGDADFNNVVDVRLTKGKLTDDELREVCRLSSLKSLHISRLDDSAFYRIEHPIQIIPSLFHVPPPRVKITDAGVAHLQPLRLLETLELAGTEITNEAVRNLRGRTNLVALNLSGNRLDDDCVPFFRTKAGDVSGFPHLRSLNLIGTGITDEGLAALVRELPDVKQIQVKQTYVTPAGVKAVRAQWNGEISFDKSPPSGLSGRGQIKLADDVYYDIPSPLKASDALQEWWNGPPRIDRPAP